MKSPLFAVAALLTVVLCPSQAWSRQQQPIKYFGYSDADLSRVSSYTNFSYIAASYDSSVVPQLRALNGKGMRAVIDLGRVLWCQNNPNDPYFGGWHLCRDEDSPGGNYVARWNAWVSAHPGYLNSTYVLGFSVMTEHTLRGVPVGDVETATALVKNYNYYAGGGIKTMIFENADHIADAGGSYQVPNNVDWVGSFKYSIEPEFDDKFKRSIQVLKSNKQDWQKLVYILDGIYGSAHQGVAPTVNDMDAIAQQWYRVASLDSEAVLLGVFTWPDVPQERLIGSGNMGATVLNKHAAIGKAILGGRYPSYQGSHDVANCVQIDGWAWDTSQPNTPISVDIYVDGYRHATVRANIASYNLVRAGIGNGSHWFSYSLPASLQDGRTHVITVKYNGTELPLNNTFKSIRCSNPSVSVAWVIPSEYTWGPPNTMTVAGYAQGGFGGVKMSWLDASEPGNRTPVEWEPIPSSADNTWSNTIPAANRCHDYWVYANYAGVNAPMFVYKGLESGYCTESVRIIWAQPQTTAGIGAPGSLVVAGSAENAPPGYGVHVWYRDVTAGTDWVLHPYAPAPNSDGIWLLDIPNVDYYHVYELSAYYDVVHSQICTYQGNNSLSWCP